MRCLSVRQPWAWLIVHGHKPVENRTWSTDHRGRLLIHAGLTFDDAGYTWVRSNFPGLRVPLKSEFERGGIVGRAQLIACIDQSLRMGPFGHILDSPWFFGPVGWVLQDPEPLEFRRYKGRLGLFHVRERTAEGG